MFVRIVIIGASLLIYHYKREFVWRSAELGECMVQLLLLETEAVTDKQEKDDVLNQRS